MVTTSIHLLTAVRIGENWPPALARQLATVAHLAPGRLNVNIISSDLAGEHLDSAPRYQRTAEAIAILRDLLDGRPSTSDGDFYSFNVTPPRIATGPRPPLYFGGLSPAARDVAARYADVYLMWPDTMENVAEIIRDMRERAASYGRELRFGYRIHVVVRETEMEARAAAQHLIAALDEEQGRAMPRRTSGPVLAALARDAGPRSWVPHSRSSTKLRNIASSVSKPSSSRATPTLTSVSDLRIWCCHSWRTRRCTKSIPRCRFDASRRWSDGPRRP